MASRSCGADTNLLKVTVAHPVVFTICFFAACLASFALFPWLGQDFFPAVDSGQFKLHVRAQTGTRIEETARLCDLVEDSIRREIPAKRVVEHSGQHWPAILGYQLRRTATRLRSDLRMQTSWCRLTEKHRPTDEYVHATSRQAGERVSRS